LGISPARFEVLILGRGEKGKLREIDTYYRCPKSRRGSLLRIFIEKQRVREVKTIGG